MLLNKILFFILCLISVATSAMDCDLAKAINHPSLANSEEFWVRLSAINPKDDFALKKLITSYSPDALGSGQAAQRVARISSAAVETSHKAEKAIVKLVGINKKHYDDFLKTVNEKGVQGFYDNPGKWHYEKLPQYGEHAHSIRLDGGNRVLFDVEKDGSILVREVSNKVGH